MLSAPQAVCTDGSTVPTSELSYRSPVFVDTLPFDQNLVRRYITESILRRTRNRWYWFVEAQRLNPALGTLIYLPAEVRRLIWGSLFECRATLSSEGLWEYEHKNGPIFDLEAYYFGFGRRGLAGYNGFQGLRQVSSGVKSESDEAFLTLRTFRFNETRNLLGFLDQLTPSTADRLRSFEFGICLRCKSNCCPM